MEDEPKVNVDDPRTAMIIEIAKMSCFLEHNQLIQANAINQKLTQKLQEIVAKDSVPEQHKFWPAFKTTFLINRFILSGDTKDAAKELIDLAKQLHQ